MTRPLGTAWITCPHTGATYPFYVTETTQPRPVHTEEKP